MKIRRAREKDIGAVLCLLSQVLEIHAAIRPDIFVSGTTKYTETELKEMFRDDVNPVFVAVNNADEAVGYAFCRLQEPPFTTTMRPRKSFFIDDLCVDETCRGLRIGETLYRFVVEEAKKRGCAAVTLNVWEGNDAAKRFYEKMGMQPKETQMEFML
ncbi:MAG: GNAT family N-acetyltransferase [Clostridia bacterium]|nr:GNAT family N-acetyltransferase [Clostridia bacterium]